MKKLFAVLLLAVLLSFTTCSHRPPEEAAQSQATPEPTADPYHQPLLDAAQVCQTIYTASEKSASANVVLSDSVVRQMVDAVAALGRSVIDEDGILDMRNPEPLITFGHGDTAECAYYTVYRDGHIGLSVLKSDQTLYSASATFTGEAPSIYLECVYNLTELQYTEKGWLIYARDQSASQNPKQFNIDPHTMVRVAPLSQEYRDLCAAYITPVGYSENNLFTCTWSEDDCSPLDFSSLYAMLFGMTHDGETLTWYTAKSYYEQPEGSALYQIPQAEFESTVQTYFRVPTDTLRQIAEYNAAQQCYYFLGWQTGYYDVVPRIPTPEVVDAVYHADGTITLTVDALFSWHGTDQAFRHAVTVRPNTDGTFQYVSNQVLSDDPIFPERELPTRRSSALRQLQH